LMQYYRFSGLLGNYKCLNATISIPDKKSFERERAIAIVSLQPYGGGHETSPASHQHSILVCTEPDVDGIKSLNDQRQWGRTARQKT
jgi:hypothetical protein